MGKRVSAESQKEAASKLLEDVSSIEGVEGEVLTRTNGTQDRNIALRTTKILGSIFHMPV